MASTLEADEYVDSFRFRLGGEATLGHDDVSSLIHAAAQQCDHTSEMGVPGLIPGTDLTPADVLRFALSQQIHRAQTQCRFG